MTTFSQLQTLQQPRPAPASWSPTKATALGYPSQADEEDGPGGSAYLGGKAQPGTSTGPTLPYQPSLTPTGQPGTTTTITPQGGQTTTPTPPPPPAPQTGGGQLQPALTTPGAPSSGASGVPMGPGVLPPPPSYTPPAGAPGAAPTQPTISGILGVAGQQPVVGSTPAAPHVPLASANPGVVQPIYQYNVPTGSQEAANTAGPPGSGMTAGQYYQSQTGQPITNTQAKLNPTPIGPAGIESWLYQRLNGVSGASGVDDELRQAIQQALTAPGRYDSALVGQSMDVANQKIAQQQQADLRRLEEAGASRGLTRGGTFYTSGGADLASNYNLQREDARLALLRDAAATNTADRTAAINNAQQFTTTRWGQQQDALNAALGYGQQSFNNQLATAQFNADLDNSDLQLILAALGAV